MEAENIFSARCRRLNETARPKGGRYVLYWMQQSQRARCNHALEFAVHEANRHRLPVLVVFGLTPDYPEANWRHYTFMLEGLEETEKHLAQRGIALKITIGQPAQAALAAARKAAVLVCDRGYLRHQRRWRKQAAAAAPCPVVEVESDAIVPVGLVSRKTEYAARTIRPKINRLVSGYMVPLPSEKLKVRDPDLAAANHFRSMTRHLKTDARIQPVSTFFKGGYAAARRKIERFVLNKLSLYPDNRNRPELDTGSMMSPYLHFGHIAPLEIALLVQAADAAEEAKKAFLEELIVRRELAVNYVTYCRRYDTFEGLPHWARTTLDIHSTDTRDPTYSANTLEAAQTHDPYWNAAMDEMKHTGYMHPYMRMYWGKKILQWHPDPGKAFDLTLKLNNTYFVDGRDVNSYAGVGWIFGLHDQAWKERPIFGKVRYMARSGLERKFDIQGYVDKVARRIHRIKHDGKADK